MTKQDIRAEGMRIGGKTVHTDKVVEVRYPYTDEVIGTVPAGTAEHARQAFEIAAAYQPKLTRYERQQILFRAAELIRERREEIAHWLTLELGICKQHSLYEAGRSYDVFTLAGQLAIQDDGQIFSCDLTPHGKSRKIFTKREPVRTISARSCTSFARGCAHSSCSKFGLLSSVHISSVFEMTFASARARASSSGRSAALPSTFDLVRGTQSSTTPPVGSLCAP